MNKNMIRASFSLFLIVVGVGLVAVKLITSLATSVRTNGTQGVCVVVDSPVYQQVAQRILGDGGTVLLVDDSMTAEKVDSILQKSECTIVADENTDNPHSLYNRQKARASSSKQIIVSQIVGGHTDDQELAVSPKVTQMVAHQLTVIVSDLDPRHRDDFTAHYDAWERVSQSAHAQEKRLTGILEHKRYFALNHNYDYVMATTQASNVRVLTDAQANDETLKKALQNDRPDFVMVDRHDHSELAKRVRALAKEFRLPVLSCDSDFAQDITGCQIRQMTRIEMLPSLLTLATTGKH